jgi:hypothetical protein
MLVEVIEKDRQAPPGSSELQQIVARQVAEIVEADQGGPGPDLSREGQWSYRVPFPGVRYYSYQQSYQQSCQER